MPVFHVILKDVVALPPEGSKAQAQDDSGMFTPLVLVAPVYLCF